MSESTDDKSDPGSSLDETSSLDSKKVIRRNLNSFLNPGFGATGHEADPNGAAHLRMAQMELANKMRLNKDKGPKPKAKPKAVPMHRSPPPGGFGSAHGVFQIKQKGQFGKKPTSSKPSPYQQILANASSKDDSPSGGPLGGGEIEEVLANQPVKESHELEVIDVPYDAEVTQGEKRLKGKRFRNPRL